MVPKQEFGNQGEGTGDGLVFAQVDGQNEVSGDVAHCGVGDVARGKQRDAARFRLFFFSSRIIKGGAAMTGLDALQSVQFVPKKGKRLAILSAKEWEALIEWLETLEDAQVARVNNPTDRHEEGGWIYLDLSTGVIVTRRASAGTRSRLSLANPTPAKGDEAWRQ